MFGWLHKVLPIVEKSGAVSLTVFSKTEPFVQTALILSGNPAGAAAAGVLNSIEHIVENTETRMADAKGADKAAQAKEILQGAILPALQVGLKLAGQTIDLNAAAEAGSKAIDATVAVKNAETSLVSQSNVLASMEAVNKAMTALMQAGLEIQAAISATVVHAPASSKS